MSMCLSSSRSLVAPGRGLGGVALAAPWWRSLVGSALFRRVPLAAAGLGSGVLRCGARRRLRLPGRGGSVRGGVDLVVRLSLIVRRFTGRAGPVWGVSVPVCVPPDARSLAAPPPSGLPAPVWVARA